MADHIDDGGPAFPVETITNLGGGASRTHRVGGMTLRDYFAAQFMERSQSLVENDGGWDMDTAADCAYAMADAMLKARAA